MVETSDPISPPKPMPLEYGRRSKWRGTFNRVVRFACLTLVLLAGWKWGPTAYKRVAIYYYQWRCLNNSAPRDLVVYESDPQAAKILLQRPGYFEADMLVLEGRKTVPPIKRPLLAAYRPPYWDGFLSVGNIQLISSPMPGEPSVRAICFLGELRSPSGKRWLVVVDCVPNGYPGTSPGLELATIHAYSTIPGTVWQGPAASFTNVASRSVVNAETSQPHGLKVFAGQRDPADPSHFTIPYQIWGEQSAVDGRIYDAGNVTLTLRRQF